MSARIVVEEEEPLNDVEEPPFEYREVNIRKDKWVKDEFEILDFLGRGKFGEVKRCSEKETGREFAAKFICAPRPQDKKDVEHEVDIMKKLQHKRLIQLYDAFESKSEMCLVMEIIYGGELFDRVISDDFLLTERACVAFVRQICEGLEYMHATRIIHLDMKPENILCLTRTGNRVKIIDFGLAREFHPKKDLRVLFGTPEFMAPEVVQYEPISFGTDMWSVGVICYVLLSGLSPFMGDTDADTLTNVIKSQFDYNYAEFDDVSEDAKDLISRLLVKDKNKRLTATECLNHEWLQKPPPEDSSSLQLTKKRLKRFVYRRKWQKIVNAIIALRRMGFQLMSIKRSSLGQIATTEEVYGRDLTSGPSGDIKADDLQRVLEVKNYDINKRKPSDSGYESVAVGDKDATKDFADEGADTSKMNGDVIPKKVESLKPSSKAVPPTGSRKSPQAEAQPSGSGTTSGKKSVMEKFGGLFSNHSKDKESTLKKDKSGKKGLIKKLKDKDKVQNSLVKKDSTKRKVGTKPKQENYVTTPGVKKKEMFFGNDFDASAVQVDKAEAPQPATKSKNNGNGTKSRSSKGKKVTREGAPTPNGNNDVGDNGEEDESAYTPSLLLGNVKNKMKMFENNGRAS